MTLHFFDNVFLLNLTLESSESVFEGLTLLKPDFSQTNYTPKLVQNGPNSYCKVKQSSQAQCQNFRQRKKTSIASAALRYYSKSKPQRDLDLSRSIRVRCFHEIDRLAVISREMADSNDLLLLRKLPGSIEKSVVAQFYSLIISVQQIERFNHQFKFCAFANKQAP